MSMSYATGVHKMYEILRDLSMAQLALLALSPGENQPLGGEGHHVRPTHLRGFDTYPKTLS